MSLFKRYYPVLVAVLVAVLPLGMNTYWTEVAVNVGLYALLALSLNVILGQAGIFHMGHAAFYAVGAYVTAILNTHYQIPILLLIPVAGAAAALFALVVARPIIHLRGDYLLIVTIGIVEIVRIALINDVFGLTGGANGIFGIARPEIFGIKIRKAIQFYYLIWIMVGLTVLLFHWLSESRFGRALNCIKEDDTAAEGCGMDVAHLKLMAFVIGAFWAGMAGNLFAAKMTIISPSSFTFWESVVVFAVVILSGGSQIGVLLGTFLIVALPEMFRDFASARMLVFGLAMMIMMVVRPQGLLPPSPRRYDVRRLLRRTRDFSSPVAPRTARKEGAAQRRGQDHGVQPDHGQLRPGRGRHPVCRAVHQGHEAAYHREPRHCPDVPVHPPVPHAAAGGKRPCGPPLPDAQRDHRFHVPHSGAAP